MEGARPATVADLAEIANLARAAKSELSAEKGGGVWSRREARPEPLEAGFAEALDDDDQLLLVGTIDDAPVGYAAVRIESLPDGGRLAILQDLYVDPEGREVGVGQMLMETALSWSAAAGCFGIDSLALPGDRETKNFFESAGLVARAIIVHRALEP
jgi:ribosomal protein S18 acetylase RimI-like enzyme